VTIIDHQVVTLEKRVPLTISRGTHTHSEIVWLRWREDGIEGWGEAVPFSIGDRGGTVADIVTALASVRESLRQSSAWDRVVLEQNLRNNRVSSALVSGLNQAMLDWLGKKLGQPVWRLFGLTPRAGPLTSATIGIAAPDAARHRVRLWRASGDFRAFKIKLGSPAGLAADRAMFEAVRDEVGPGIRLSVDANGGWSVADACAMSAWLAERGVDHVEQPLARGQEAELPRVRAACSLPVFVDESCCTSRELAALIGRVDGINIKLMKCGGLDEALRLVATARAHGLRILVGCYGSSALGNTAAATLGPLVDCLDLDSHLNLKDDPFQGAALEAGWFSLPAAPGFGVTHE
jgi:L-alanine-DL-glutamate epimerase-like enolase superfamily enzyme